MTRAVKGKFRDSLRVVATRYVMSRHHKKTQKINKLQCEIVELEKQLKQHPLGTIILNAKIKQKRIMMRDLNYKKLKRGIDRKKRFVIRSENKIRQMLYD